MKIKFPINNDRDFETIMALINPELFNIEYASLEARELYNSLTSKEKIEIINYINTYKKGI